jgi:phosphate starvation-inducible protein PhoH and related proteins
MTEATIPLVDSQRALSLFGPRDQHLRSIREAFGVAITHRDGEIKVLGEEGPVALAKAALTRLNTQLNEQDSLAVEQVADVLAEVTGQRIGPAPSPIEVQSARKVTPRTPGQARYIQSIRDHDITFAVGPAGTGKTYLAVAVAVEGAEARPDSQDCVGSACGRGRRELGIFARRPARQDQSLFTAAARRPA